MASRASFKRTIHKEQKEKEKEQAQKYVRMRKLLSVLRDGLKVGAENDHDISVALVKLFDEHFPKGYLYETETYTRTISRKAPDVNTQR